MKQLVLFIILFLSSCVPFFIETESTEGVKENLWDQYNPKLLELNSTEKLLSFVEKEYDSKKGEIPVMDTLLFVDILSNTIKKRFYHGLANYKPEENWIALLFGRTVWTHIKSKVISDEILKHSQALCSQQTIVFLELLKKKGITFRHVGLGFEEGPGHFVCEVKYGGGWHLYDVTMEPDWERITHRHESLSYYLVNPDELLLTYENRINKERLKLIISKVSYGKENVLPARNMRILHQVTKLLTYFLPIVFGTLVILKLVEYKKKSI